MSGQIALCNIEVAASFCELVDSGSCSFVADGEFLLEGGEFGLEVGDERGLFRGSRYRI
jgi:hypothetical protein